MAKIQALEFNFSSGKEKQTTLMLYTLNYNQSKSKEFWDFYREVKVLTLILLENWKNK
jgi:hypothetical protein